jgi:hypothetical protein
MHGGAGWGWLLAQETTELPTTAAAAPAAVCRNCRRVDLRILRVDAVIPKPLGLNVVVLLRVAGWVTLMGTPNKAQLVGPLYHHSKTYVKQFRPLFKTEEPIWIKELGLQKKVGGRNGFMVWWSYQEGARL